MTERGRLRLVFTLINGVWKTVDLCKCQNWSSDHLGEDSALGSAALAMKGKEGTAEEPEWSGNVSTILIPMTKNTAWLRINIIEKIKLPL